MLSGATADLQDITGSGKGLSQNCEDGIPVLFTGLGILFYDDLPPAKQDTGPALIGLALAMIAIPGQPSGS